jgi:hypothetical protein
MRPVPVYRCTRAISPLDPTADLTRPPWRAAAWLDDFRQLGTDDAMPPERALGVALLWDDQHLYAAFRSAPSLVPVNRWQRDEDLWTECAVEFFLAAGAGYYEFEINPRGALLDLHFADEQDDDWRAARTWDAAGIRWAVRDGGEGDSWQAEVALPWAAVPHLTRQASTAGEVLQVQLCRSGSRPDLSWELPVWGPATRAFCERSGMGRVVLVP